MHLLKAKTGKKRERGFSVLEAMIASFIMLIGIGGLMALFVVAAAKNAGQGDQPHAPPNTHKTRWNSCWR